MTRAVVRILALLVLSAAASFAQFPFQILVTSGTQQATITNGTQIPFNAEVGQSMTWHITATYLPAANTNTIAITQQPTLIGSTEFRLANFPTLPVMLNAGGTLQFDLTFKSTSANQAAAQLTVNMVETSQGGVNGPVTTPIALVLPLLGQSPSFSLFYVLQASPNAIQIPSGGTVMFPSTQVNTTASANLDVENVGSGAGMITKVTFPNDPAFKLTGVGPLPISVPANGAAAVFTITYAPTAATADSDQIQITLASGTVLTVMLQGNGINSSFAYSILSGSAPTALTPPGPIALPDANIGSTSSVTIRVQNIGNANGTINSAPIVSGNGFTVTGAPLFPDTLKPNDSFTFTINFAPTGPGPQKGNLIVGGDLFNLTGNGLGPQLTFAYMAAGGSNIFVATGGTLVFSPVQVTQSEQDMFTVTNSGTQTATIASISIGEANSPFSVSGVQYPISLAPGATTQFTVTFAPTTAGGITAGTLHIDTNLINLVGSGTQPPALPNYSFQGPSGNVAPQTQPTIGLTLASGYPVALSGTLALTTNGNAVSDPAVQFSTGGTNIAFTIPANSTTANFASVGPQVSLQTGTIAENLVLTPTFQTQAGAISLTPSPAPALTLTVPSAAPTLLAVAPANLTANGFTLNVTGISTTRSVTTLTVQFNAAAGFNFGTNAQVTIDLTSQSTAYYGSATSHPFGGQFEVSVPFTFTGTNLPTGKTPIQAITSVSATVTNSVGTSNSLQTALQ